MNIKYAYMNEKLYNDRRYYVDIIDYSISRQRSIVRWGLWATNARDAYVKAQAFLRRHIKCGLMHHQATILEIRCKGK